MSPSPIASVNAVSLPAIEQFVLKAKLHGYVDPKAKRYLVPGRPGLKQVIYQDGLFVMIDEWGTGPQLSTGQTIIWFDDQPVWVMHYWGTYQPESLDFLKAVLGSTYRAKQFYGGRGYPHRISDDGKMEYRNVIYKAGFEDFEGLENINRYGRGDERLGYHHYRGYSLI